MVVTEKPHGDRWVHRVACGLNCYLALMPVASSILVLVKEKIFVAWVVGPQVFDALVDLAVLLNLLEILDYFERGARALRIVNELVLGCWPGSVLELGG